MALRSGARVFGALLAEAGKRDAASPAAPGLLQDIRKRVSTGKILRPDVEDDILRQPVETAKYRFPSPGSQEPPVVPQGSYKNVFDITYHNRDSRRHIVKEEFNPADAVQSDLPPTPGNPITVTFLGMAGDFDVRK